MSENLIRPENGRGKNDGHKSTQVYTRRNVVTYIKSMKATFMDERVMDELKINARPKVNARP